ncbi:carbohydrate kinase family protein [Glycomyces algeriensis]|uniref:Fructokinase n=1 Tax=Glycomyces algeriensis TaxID=256037 RepID=A0A9W6LH47_9ACTN|nr:carbohydrate kinase [Glycomyces algeriensis]MDA1364163.1 carbohydrate kinase [Glycomyces algeriensis]MDR7350188.1 fructokinase [Glycomyces algeriensis]GLI42900.1 fructokinase [Glycomyces algeriensis]
MIGVVGEALIDLVVAESDPSRPVAHPGGSPMNVAVTVGRLESPVAFLGRLSGDAFGDLLRSHLASSGVDLRWSVDAREPTSLAVVSVAPDGGAGYSFHVHRTADWQWTPAELAAAPGFEAVHAGSLALALEPGGPVVEAWLEGLKDSTTISLDPNVRPELLGDRDRYRERVDRWMAFADLVKISDEDLEWIWPGSDPAELARGWVARGRRLVVVTRGGDGSQVFGNGYEFSVAAHRATIVDTVGAGDSFSGGLLHWLDRVDRLRPDRLANLTGDEARDAVEFASAVAAATCSRAGANPPRRSELAVSPSDRAFVPEV